jgi:hypothetical protein
MKESMVAMTTIVHASGCGVNGIDRAQVRRRPGLLVRKNQPRYRSWFRFPC